MFNFPEPHSIPELILLTVITVAAIWAIFANHEKKEQQQIRLYKPGDLFVFPDRDIEDGYIVYSLPDDYANLYEGTLDECWDWIQQNTDYSGCDE